MLSTWLALTLTFCALRALPSDAIEARLRASGASPAQVAAGRTAFGLDDPLPVQYANYLVGLPRGDLGISLVTREPVTRMILARLGPTLALSLSALIIATLSGIVLGTMAVSRSAWGMLAEGLIALGLAAPVYWTATLLIYLAAHPLAGWGLPSGGTRGAASVILPALALGFSIGGGIARQTAGALQTQAREAFIQTARAKGLAITGVYGHRLRAAAPAIISIVALQAGFLLSGAVIIEIIFTRRGLGSLLYQAVLDQDYPVVQGLVLLAALVYALLRLAGQSLMQLADPRLRPDA